MNNSVAVRLPQFYATSVPGSNGAWWAVRDRLSHGGQVASFTYSVAGANEYAARRHADWLNGRLAGEGR